MQKHFRFPAMLVFFFVQIAIAAAQDSLIVQRDTFDVKDRIEFYPKITETFSVPTISCSCGNDDFMYRVYRFENGKWKLFVDHTEPENSPKCTCNHFAMQLKDGVMYSIDAINTSGIFYLEVTGGRLHPVSAKFVLTGE